MAVRSRRQTLLWRVSNPEESIALPAELGHSLWIGPGELFQARVAFDARGDGRGIAADAAPAFVVSRGSVTTVGSETLAFRGLLRDADLAYEPGTSALRIRLFDGRRTVVDRDFSALGHEVLTPDPDGGQSRTGIRTAPDDAESARIARFSYDGGTGRFDLRMDRLAIDGLTRFEAHLGVELTVGDRAYFTAVTFFEGAQGRYGTTAPPR